jgi:hypothetical protein
MRDIRQGEVANIDIVNVVIRRDVVQEPWPCHSKPFSVSNVNYEDERTDWWQLPRGGNSTIICAVVTWDWHSQDKDGRRWGHSLLVTVRVSGDFGEIRCSVQIKHLSDYPSNEAKLQITEHQCLTILTVENIFNYLVNRNIIFPLIKCRNLLYYIFANWS